MQLFIIIGWLLAVTATGWTKPLTGAYDRVNAQPTGHLQRPTWPIWFTFQSPAGLGRSNYDYTVLNGAADSAFIDLDLNPVAFKEVKTGNYEEAKKLEDSSEFDDANKVLKRDSYLSSMCHFKICNLGKRRLVGAKRWPLRR